MSSHRRRYGPVAIASLALAVLVGRGQPASARADGGARVTVIVPADAELFFDGVATTQKGIERVFATPALQPGTIFHYNIVARWKDGGKPIEQKRQVDVTEGAKVRVVFPKPAEDKGGPADPKPQPVVEDQEVVTSKSAPRPAAATVNFRKDLNLPFATLGTLGARVDAARRGHDPVALANAASELNVAEKVSGKKASLTSSALMNEAAQLASLRRQEAELRATLQMSNQIETAQGNIALMQQNLAMAQQQAKADAESWQQGQEPTWTPRKVVVNNYTTQYMDVYVNGTFKVTVLPGQTQAFTIEHRWNPTVLTAWGDGDNGVPWKRIINGRFTKYTWNLN